MDLLIFLFVNIQLKKLLKISKRAAESVTLPSENSSFSIGTYVCT